MGSYINQLLVLVMSCLSSEVSSHIVEYRAVIIDGVETGYQIGSDGSLLGLKGQRCKDTENEGYVRNTLQLNKESKSFLRHRLVAKAFCFNPRPEYFVQVDHIDGNKKNNWYWNIRYVMNRINSLNQKSKHIKCRTDRVKKPYEAKAQFHNRKKHIGYFATEEEAMSVQDDTRQLLCDMLYAYHTRPMTYPPPTEWVIKKRQVMWDIDSKVSFVVEHPESYASYLIQQPVECQIP